MGTTPSNTPRLIQEHFAGLQVQGAELAPALSNSLMVWKYHDQISDRWSLRDWRSTLGILRPILIHNLHIRNPKTGSSYLHQSNILCLSFGVERVLQITRPILQALEPATRQVLFTKHCPSLNPGRVSSASFSRLGTPAAWEQELAHIWPELADRVASANRRFQLSPRIRYQILGILAQAVINVFRSQSVLDRVQPQVIVLEHDRQAVEAVFCQVARQRGVPSVTLVHGIQGVDADSDTKWAPLMADRVLVWGEWMRQYFLQQGVTSNSIQIGGYPRMHPLNSKDRHQAEKWLAADARLDCRPRVLFVSSSLRNEKPSIRLFLDTAVQNPGVHFLIRPHPREDLSWYSQHASLDQITLQDPGRWSLAQSLASANIVVGSGSTTCVDALLAALPLILVPEPGHDHNTLPILRDAIAAGAAQVAQNPAELTRLIHEILNEISPYCQAAADFASKCAAYLGDEAATISASLIAELASSSKH